MSSVQEIEQAIAALSLREMDEVYLWMDEQIAARLDVTIARELEVEAFDDVIDRALADEKAGRIRSL